MTYYYRDALGQSLGPCTATAIRELLESDALSDESWIARSASGPYMELYRYPDLCTQKTDRRVWYFRDEHGAIQGPYGTVEVKKLKRRMKPETRIKLGSQGDFMAWKDVAGSLLGENYHISGSFKNPPKFIKEGTDNIMKMVQRRAKKPSMHVRVPSFHRRSQSAGTYEMTSEQMEEMCEKEVDKGSPEKSRKKLFGVVTTPRKTNFSLASFKRDKEEVKKPSRLQALRSRTKRLAQSFNKKSQEENYSEEGEATEEEESDEEGEHYFEDSDENNSFLDIDFLYTPTDTPDTGNEASFAFSSLINSPVTNEVHSFIERSGQAKSSLLDSETFVEQNKTKETDSKLESIQVALALQKDENSHLRAYIRELQAVITDKLPDEDLPAMTELPKNRRSSTSSATSDHLKDSFWEDTLMVEFDEDSPMLRKKVSVFEEGALELQHDLKTLIKRTRNSVEAMQYSVQCSKEFVHSCDVSEEMRKISPLVPIFNRKMEAFTQLQRELSSSFENHYIEGLAHFVTTELQQTDLNRRELLKARETYESLEAKYMHHRRAKGRVISGVGRTHDTVESQMLSDLQEARGRFEKSRFGLIQDINHLENKKRFLLLSHTAACSEDLLSFFRRGYVMMMECSIDIKDTRENIRGVESKFKESVERWNEMRSLLDQEMEGKPARVVVESRSSRSSHDPTVMYEGYLYKRSSGVRRDWKRRWFSLRGDKLWYYRQWSDSDPRPICDMMLCTVREVTSHPELRCCFEIISPHKRPYMLQAINREEMNTWIAAIRRAIEIQLQQQMHPETNAANSESVTNLMAANPVCADCAAIDPNWVSINLGILVCIHCSGIHRSLGSHISKVRSLTLDKVSPEQMGLFQKMGNKRVNLELEFDLKTSKPTETATQEEREEFIKNKYVNLMYSKPRRLEDLEQVVSENNVAALLTLILFNPQLDKSFGLEIAAKHGNKECFELLLLNGVEDGISKLSKSQSATMAPSFRAMTLEEMDALDSNEDCKSDSENSSIL